MVSLFREKSTTGIFWLIALSALLHANFLIHAPQMMTVKGEGLLYEIMQPLYALPPLAILLLYPAIVVVQALRLNYILNDARMFSKAAFTTAMSYILLTALLPEWNNLTPALLANSLLIWLVLRFIKLYNAPQPNGSIFNTGLITGCTILLYHPTVALVLPAFFALAILRPFRISEWFVLLLGIITPFYWLLAIVFLYGNIQNWAYYFPQFQLHILNPGNKIALVTTFITASVLIVGGIFYWQKNILRMIIHVRKYWSVFLFMLLLQAAVVFFTKDAGMEALLLCTVPAAAFVSFIFISPRMNFIPAILFWSSVAVVVYNNWFAVK